MSFSFTVSMRARERAREIVYCISRRLVGRSVIKKPIFAPTKRSKHSRHSLCLSCFVHWNLHIARESTWALRVTLLIPCLKCLFILLYNDAFVCFMMSSYEKFLYQTVSNVCLLLLSDNFRSTIVCVVCVRECVYFFRPFHFFLLHRNDNNDKGEKNHMRTIQMNNKFFYSSLINEIWHRKKIPICR